MQLNLLSFSFVFKLRFVVIGIWIMVLVMIETLMGLATFLEETLLAFPVIDLVAVSLHFVYTIINSQGWGKHNLVSQAMVIHPSG